MRAMDAMHAMQAMQAKSQAEKTQEMKEEDKRKRTNAIRGQILNSFFQPRHFLIFQRCQSHSPKIHL